MKMRVDKFLTTTATATRSEASRAARQGRILVNDVPCKNASAQIDPDVDVVTFDGEVVVYSRYVYILLNKPAGYVCTASDPHAPLKALDLIVPAHPVRLFSAGRLDKESSGLIIFSNDGDFVAQLTHPKFQIVKRYQVRLAAELSPEAQKQMIKGIKDEGELLRVLKVRSLGGCRYELFLNEGKKREIRRLAAALGAPVIELDRLSVGQLELGALPRGEWRRLNPDEVKAALAPAKDC